MNQLSELAVRIEESMVASLLMADPIDHPAMKGGEYEKGWIKWMKDYLPSRYQVTSGKIIDCMGQVSDQIDIIIHDRNFSSPILVSDCPIMVPVESVYAIFESKSDISAENIVYAQKKAESVRKLVRTNARIRHIDGISPTENKLILAGILTKKTTISDYEGEIRKHNPVDIDPIMRLDFGCSADGHGFFNDGSVIDFLPEENTLVNFLYRLLTVLQLHGSIAGIEYDKYLNTINNQ